MFENRREIMQDVFLTYLPAQHFKTSRLTLNLIAPLRRETASANALLPAVMRRGTVRYPDMESLSAALDTLYGANIDYTVRKKGERQCVGFAAGFIDDAFTPHGEKLLEPVAELLGELLLEPVTQRGRFLSEYVDSEKANLIDAIRGLKNDKRDWADIRLMQEMCAGEPYSVLRLGDEETASRLNNQTLYTHGQALLSGSRVELIYCGSAEEKRVEDAVLAALAALPKKSEPPSVPRFSPTMACSSPSPASVSFRQRAEGVSVPPVRKNTSRFVRHAATGSQARPWADTSFQSCHGRPSAAASSWMLETPGYTRAGMPSARRGVSRPDAPE